MAQEAVVCERARQGVVWLVLFAAAGSLVDAEFVLELLQGDALGFGVDEEHDDEL